ncbi:hypothetical protein X975_13200, partial [Stegodyphus mimosarum]
MSTASSCMNMVVVAMHIPLLIIPVIILMFLQST